MKVFLSQPMRGKTHEEILSNIREVQEFLTKYLDSTNIEIIESYSPKNKDKEPLVALGDSIKEMAKADLAVFLDVSISGSIAVVIGGIFFIVLFGKKVKRKSVI